MLKKRLIKEYKRSLNDLKSYSQKLGISDGEFENIFNDCLNCLTPKKSRSKSVYMVVKKRFWFIISLVLFVFTFNFVFNGKPVSLFLCKIQEFIYPGLRLLRIISVPIISTFPSLTELYDETCLIQNPFFKISDMDCWPCADVQYIQEISSTDFEPNASPPFIYKTNQKIVNFEHLKIMYQNNKKVFDKDASKILVNNEKNILPEKFFMQYSTTNKSGNHHLWRLNRMLPAQLIRSLFPRPDVIPRLGLSTERFIVFDEPKVKTYKIPDPECNFVFIIQSMGQKLIELRPSSECTDQCRTVSILLEPSYLLWYNWWYWRPVAHHPSNSTSISYIGSYC